MYIILNLKTKLQPQLMLTQVRILFEQYVHESAVGDVPKRQKVIGVMGEKVFQTVSGEKAINTTLMTYISTEGLHVPPMLPLVTFCVSENGYISSKLFAKYGEKFVRFLRESNLMSPGIKYLVLLKYAHSHLIVLTY